MEGRRKIGGWREGWRMVGKLEDRGKEEGRVVTGRKETGRRKREEGREEGRKEGGMGRKERLGRLQDRGRRNDRDQQGFRCKLCCR